MTQQDRQIKKVKLYRVLKVVFYSLGLPLFVAAVFLASVRFMGHDPFGGNADIAGKLGFWQDINSTLTSTALYGVWIALGIWAFISIVHIILAKTVKNRRVRMMSVTALTLVVMLGTMLGMDAGLSARVEEIAKNAPSTVSVADYKTLLSYYRTISSSGHGKSYTESLIDRVNMAKKAYNVDSKGISKTGYAGSVSNKPATYYDVIGIDENGEPKIGVDISFTTDHNTGFAKLDYDPKNKNTFPGDGQITREVEGKQVIRLEPDENDQLVINGLVYPHYNYAQRTGLNGTVVYTWYIMDMQSPSWTPSGGNTIVDGIYGDAIYTNSGLLSDGWVFGLDNVLEILEDYYEAKEAIDNGDATYYANAYAQMYQSAWERRNAYYTGKMPGPDGEYADKWIQALYSQEVYLTEKFSLTRGELDELLAKVGALLGDNKLFDYLFSSIDDALSGEDSDLNLGGIIEQIPFLGGSFGNFFKKLNAGLGLSEFGLDSGTLNTIVEILGLLTGKTYDYVDDLILTLSYKAPDCYGVKHDNLYVGLVRGVGEWKFVDGGETVPAQREKVDVGDGKFEWVWKYTEDGTDFITTTANNKTYDKDGNEIEFVISAGKDPSKDIMLDIDFNDEELKLPGNIFDEENGTPTYAFDFDTLSAFLNNGLNRLLENYNVSLSEGTVGTIVNLVKTLGLLKTIDVDGESYTGLVISGIEIPILNSQGKVALDINGILTNLLQNWYSYKSAVIKPVWDFYADWEIKDLNPEMYEAQLNYCKYERALYTGSTFGSMIGSTLIGDSLGTGAYPSSLGLTSLAAVQQLKTDLSYQPECFPIMAARDMIALFTGLVVLFYFISFVAAQREEDYASGKLIARNRKEKNAVKKHEAQVIAEFDALDVNKAEQGGADEAFDDASDVDELRKEQEKQEKKETQEMQGADPDVPVNQNSDEEVL